MRRASSLHTDKSALNAHSEHSDGLSENLISLNSRASREMLSRIAWPSSPGIRESLKNHSAACFTPACCDAVEIPPGRNGRSPLKTAHLNTSFKIISKLRGRPSDISMNVSKPTYRCFWPQSLNNWASISNL